MALLIKIKQVVNFGINSIDYELRIAGVFVMGGIVFCINYISRYEIFGAFTASLKQGSYTFLFGGGLLKGFEYLASNSKSKSI